jgi:hypothetical protein
MSGIVPKFSPGDLVDVTEYYADLIPKSYFRALVLECNIFSFGGDPVENSCIIYDVLGVEGLQLDSIQKVEEYAIHLIEKSNKRNKQ